MRSFLNNGITLLCAIALLISPRIHAAQSAPAATPAATTPADSTSTPAATASSTPAAADKDDDDDDDDDKDTPPKPGDKSAPKKKGLFGPKKLPYCKPGETPGKKNTCRIKLPKMTPVNITEGTLTINGMIAKVGLNYQIADLKYLYFWVPGLGIVTVGDKPFGAAPYGPAKEQPGAFHGKGLTVKVTNNAGEQTVELYSDAFLLHDRKPLSAWVILDPTLTPPSSDPHFKSPSFGWGVTAGAPYTWPGSKPEDPKKHALAPPVPVNLQPIIAKPTPVTLSLGVGAPAKSTATAPAAINKTPAVSTSAPEAAPTAAPATTNPPPPQK